MLDQPSITSVPFGMLGRILLAFASLAIGTENSFAEAHDLETDPPQVCSDVARHWNEGGTDVELLQGESVDEDSLPVSAEPQGYSFDRMHRVDINNDGDLDYAFETSSGTAGDSWLHFTDSNLATLKYVQDPGVDWQEDDLRWVADYLVLRWRGKHFILGKTDDRLAYVSRIDPDNVERLICRFVQKKEPMVRLRTGSESVCNAALTGKLKYSEFDKLHALSYQDLNQAGYQDTSPGERAAYIDIDNDGSEELLVPTDFSSGRGSGCGSHGLVLLDDTRTKLVASPLQNLLNSVSAGCRGGHTLPFTFDGISYLGTGHDPEFPTTNHSIHRIRNGAASEICAFDVQPINHVLTGYESLRREAENHHRDIWEYALSKPGLDAAELLLKNGHEINETSRGISLLNLAVSDNRKDVVDWLLAKGANPNQPDELSSSPLELALRHLPDSTMALRLIEAGADPTEILYQVVDFALEHPQSARTVFSAATQRIGYIPESFLLFAMRRDPVILDDLVASKLPVQGMEVHWHAGRPDPIPLWARASDFVQTNPDLRSKIDTLYRRPTPQSGDGQLVMSYGSFDDGLAVWRGTGSDVGDEELLLFATSLCMHFHKTDCGPLRVVRKARAWVKTLNYSCSGRPTRILDNDACQVVMHYAKIGTGTTGSVVVVYSLLPDDSERAHKFANLEFYFPEYSSRFLNLDDLEALYATMNARP